MIIGIDSNFSKCNHIASLFFKKMMLERGPWNLICFSKSFIWNDTVLFVEGAAMT